MRPADQHDPRARRWARSAVTGRSRARRFVRIVLVVAVCAWAVRAFLVQVFVIPSTSMEPTLRIGDRVAVSRWGDAAPHRGEIVVFDGTGLFTDDVPDDSLGQRLTDAAGAVVGRSSRTMFVKRVIGLPGEHLVCCTDDGRLTVDGRVLDEPWLPAGTMPSRLPFDVRVPPGRYWMMGDNRDVSADSRAHLGSPGGGMVPRGRIVGPVVGVVWPPSRWGDPRPPGAVSAPADPLRPRPAAFRSTTP
ncbi:MAG: signal peptidase I [Kineosporiaceae bacterium]